MAGFSSLHTGQLYLPGNTPGTLLEAASNPGLEWRRKIPLTPLGIAVPQPNAPSRSPEHIYVGYRIYILIYDPRTSTFLNHFPVDIEHLVSVFVVGLWVVRKYHNLEI
jgi:hypothetical protein